MMRVLLVIGFFLVQTLCSAAQEKTYDFVVAKDGSGDFKYVQDAIEACRAFTPKHLTIFIKAGTYKEKIVFHSWNSNLTIIGEDAETTILTYDDHAGKGKMGTFDSYSVKVVGDDMTFKNLTIQNTAGRVGQAVAIHAEGDRLKFENCRFYGDQDTMYNGGQGSRQYFKDCYIEGTTDFIFGPSTVLFEGCTIHSKKNSYVTAASTPEWVKYGYVFIDCKLTSNEEAEKVYLGRPWRDFAKTVFINCELGDHIRAEGWHNWSRPEAEKTSFYAEYNSSGAGANPEARVSWSHQLTKKQAKEYTVEKIFAGEINESVTAGDWFR
ncbi:pectinesterase family protein [Reichenbachiella ulvae]|uniref:Pectinesterase n=1 Tax=Reichenbachiella ulvae TaxID=2980104 RepID=A0ABT3CZ47_9BACT|nr:pectinesterase family protein [Reichenbachiella ulvae]MCV9388839.1 pectinesterase family protein [Reichenbachiella ulvae]